MAIRLTRKTVAHNPKVAGSNPAPATIDDDGLAVFAADPFVVSAPILHPLHRVSDDAGDAVALLTNRSSFRASAA